MKRNSVGVVAVVLVILAVAGGVAFLSHRGAWAYQGLAGRFPDRVEAFFEVSQLGQWMPAPEGKAGVAPAQTSRGTDPMLQVLQTVWAAPPVAPKDLPEILRTKPMAGGFWLDGTTLKGAALMPLGLGEREAVEKVMMEKLGPGTAVEKVAGLDLHRVEVPQEKGPCSLDQVYWGVGDQVAVVALGLDGAKAVLTPPAKALDKDAEFLAVERKLAAVDGASLFVRGALMARMADLSAAASAAPSKTAAVPESPKVTPGTDQGEGTSGPLLGEAAHRALKAGIVKFASPDSLKAFGFWTAPPKEGEKGWQLKGWLALKDSPKGVWRMASQASARTPQISGRLPKRGQTYVWCAARDPARLYQDIMDELSRDLPADQMGWVRAGIGAAEGKVGLSFANDLLPSLSDEWCFVSERNAAADGGANTCSTHGRVALFIVLRDARRFEDLVAQKLVPQLKLKPLELKGARGWSLFETEGKPGTSLLVSGGMAIITGDPAWALDTGGSPDKAWKALSDYREKACTLVVCDPAQPADAADALVKVECTSGPSGVFVKGRFPGHSPGWFAKEHGDRASETPAVPEGEGLPAKKATAEKRDGSI